MMPQQLLERLKGLSSFSNRDLFTGYWALILGALPIYLRLQPKIDIVLSHNYLFMFAVFLSLAAFGFKTVKSIQTFGVLALMLISYFNQIGYYTGPATFQWLGLSCGFLLLLQASSIGFNERIILNGMCIAALIQSIYLILNYLGYSPYDIFMHYSSGGKAIRMISKNYAWTQMKDIGEINHIIGSLGNKSYSSALLASCLPATFRKKWLMILPLGIIALYIADSTLASLGFIFGSVVWLLYKFSFKIRLIIVSLMGIIGSISVYYVLTLNLAVGFAATNGRLKVWKQSFDLMPWPENIFGRGVGFFYNVYPKMQFKPPYWTHVHNEYISAYLIFGIVGCLIIATLLVDFSRMKKHPIFMSGIAILAVNSIGNFPFHIASTSIIGIICYSYIISTHGGLKYGTNNNQKRP